jgi:hypothetical protein
VPDQHCAIDAGGEQQWHVTTLGNLQRICGEKAGIDDDEGAGNGKPQPKIPMPNLVQRDKYQARSHDTAMP